MTPSFPPEMTPRDEVSKNLALRLLENCNEDVDKAKWFVVHAAGMYTEREAAEPDEEG